MVNFLVKHKVAKNENQAKTILLVVTVIALVAAFVIFSWALAPTNIKSF